MRQIANCFFLLLLHITVHGQDTSLLHILQLKDDTVKVDKLSVYAEKFKGVDEDKFYSIYKHILKASISINNSSRVGDAWFEIACVEANRANDKDAIQGFQTALTYFKKAGMLDMVAKCYINLKTLAERGGNLELSIASLNQAISLLEGTRYKQLLYQCYLSMGTLFYNLDQYDKSIIYFYKARKGGIEKKDTSIIIFSLFGISNCLKANNKYEQAYPFAMESLKLAKLTNDKFDLCVANTCLAELYINWRKANETIFYANETSKAALACGNVQYQLIALMNLAEGYGLAKDIVSQISYLNKALSLANKKGVVMQLDDIYKSLSEAYSLKGESSKAFDFYKKFIFYRDSANNEKSKRNATELEVKYQTVQKEKILSQQQLQISRKEMQLQKSNQYILYSLGATLIALLAAGLVLFHYQNKRRLHKQEMQSLNRERQNQILHAAMEGEEKERSRIAKDLHDGVAGMLAAAKMHFGSLSITNDFLANTKEYNQGLALLDEAVNQVRQTSHNLMPEVLTKYGLEAALAKYCANISNEKVLVVKYDCWGEVKRYDSNFELAVYRIVQELLNNVIKHSQATEAFVQLSAFDARISIMIEDNGVGFKEGVQVEGMGLQSLQTRVKAMNGQIEIGTQPNSGVHVYLEFDITGLEQGTYNHI